MPDDKKISTKEHMQGCGALLMIITIICFAIAAFTSKGNERLTYMILLGICVLIVTVAGHTIKKDETKTDFKEADEAMKSGEKTHCWNSTKKDLDIK